MWLTGEDQFVVLTISPLSHYIPSISHFIRNSKGIVCDLLPLEASDVVLETVSEGQAMGL